MKAAYSPRKYWGPFCTVKQRGLPLYVHQVFPIAASGFIQDDDGLVREMTPQELDDALEKDLDSTEQLMQDCFEAAEVARAVKH